MRAGAETAEDVRRWVSARLPLTVQLTEAWPAAYDDGWRVLHRFSFDGGAPDAG